MLGDFLWWILAFNRLFEIFLVNSITRACVDLPPLLVLRSQVSSKGEWFSAVQQAILVKQRGNDITFVINRYNCCLAFSRFGEREWTQLPLSDRLFNIVCFKDQILAITVVGTLMRLDIDRRDCPRAHTVASPPEDVKFRNHVYLVVSSENLLLVYQWYQRDKMKFKVYKFDIFSSKWMVVNDLANNLLFMNNYNSISVSPFGQSLKRNCIYFAYHKMHMFVYDIKDETTEVHLINDAATFYSLPVWMMRTLG